MIKPAPWNRASDGNCQRWWVSFGSCVGQTAASRGEGWWQTPLFSGIVWLFSLGHGAEVPCAVRRRGGVCLCVYIYRCTEEKVVCVSVDGRTTRCVQTPCTASASVSWHICPWDQVHV